MSVINTNYLALVSQNNLTKSQNSLGTAIERLSSGLRINSAKDDAAGQAIANRFTANINGLSQAARNANDGISVAQTTEGALNEINENLQRIRTLTVQASTGSNSKTDLESIQAEIAMRMSEIDRVSEQTQFNGVKVLGSNQNLTVQVGAKDSETITIGLTKVTSNDLGLGDLDVGSMAKTLNVGDKVSAEGTPEAATAILANISINGGTPGGFTATEILEKDGTFYLSDGTDAYQITDQTFTSTTAATVTLAGSSVTKASITTPTTPTSLTGNYTPTVEGKATIDAGANTFAEGSSNSIIYTTGANGEKSYFIRSEAADGSVKLYDAEATQDGGSVKFTAGVENTSLDALVASPLKQIDAALQNVDSMRSDLGAIQNRFQSTIANLNNTVNNLSAARSRIEDADYAVEVSNMTRAQILQQAGTSVLAQANQVPQTVLSLLR